MTTPLPQQQLEAGSIYNGFALETIQPIKELKTTGYLFKHAGSGAHLIHLFNDDPDNLFSIAFRTPVSDSTGVPHILEHSVLCGSKRFPVKDPFQEMLKGSLQTFLNALTYPDKTVYPVSSQVEKDYFNLAAIYADAVFNPLLSENTFYQEGWHFDLEDIRKPVGIKGIVYNEMKGVFSNFASHVDRKTLSALFSDTTYFFESGGDPEHIPDLTYEQFIAFHRRFYHPTNAFIILYGNIPSEKTLKFLDEQYLSSFTPIDIDAHVTSQKLWNAPRSISYEAPAPQEEKGTATVALAWIFGDTTDPVATLTGRILGYYLLDTESSPLKRALIDSGLGEDLADISGFDSELRQSVFAVGLRKTKPEHAQKIEELVLSTLRTLADGGIDTALLKGALRQIEFSLREVTGGHFPYHLRLAERCYRSWMYDGNPFAHLAFEEPLNYIKKQLDENTSYFIDCIRQRLIDNQHRLRSTIIASPEMGTRLEQQTTEQAKRLSASFTDDDKKHYAELTATLLEQQKAPSPPEALAKLPKLTIDDLPKKGLEVATLIKTVADTPVHLHEQFTSGIIYLDCGFDLSALPSELIPYISLYTEYATRCGAAGIAYDQMATRIALSTGGIHASVASRTKTGTESDHFFHLFFHAKSLVPRFGETISILHDLFNTPDLTNEKLIRDIVLEERNGLNAAIISAGHRFAMTHAASHLLPPRYIDEQTGGISQLRFLEKLVRDNNYGTILEALQKVHEIIIRKENLITIITADEPFETENQLNAFITSLPDTPTDNIKPMEIDLPSTTPTGIEISAAVNFVAQVWKMEPVAPTTTGHLLLIAKILSAGYLWDKIRVEGGAYGGMSLATTAFPLFSCASYRDPNCASTMVHFKNGLQQIADGLPQAIISQNIIGTIGQIDSPHSPHARGFNESISLLSGNDPQFRQQLREAVFSATSEDLAAIAQGILNSTGHATTVLGSAAAFDQAAKDGFSCSREPLLPQA